MKLKILRFIDKIRFGKKYRSKIKSVISLQAMSADDARTALRLALFEVAVTESTDPNKMINIYATRVGPED